MKKQYALILTIAGAIIAVLCLGITIYSIVNYLDISQYRQLSPNIPAYALFAAGFIGGVIATLIGIKKMKSAK